MLKEFIGFKNVVYLFFVFKILVMRRVGFFVWNIILIMVWFWRLIDWFISWLLFCYLWRIFIIVFRFCFFYVMGLVLSVFKWFMGSKSISFNWKNRWIVFFFFRIGVFSIYYIFFLFFRLLLVYCFLLYLLLIEIFYRIDFSWFLFWFL